MRLTAAELSTVRAILEKIERGETQPQLPDRIGRFFRQYQSGRGRLDAAFAQCSVWRRADAAISGAALGRIEVHPMLSAEVSLRDFPLGEVAETLAISEELGGLVNFVMWLKGPVANAAYNVLRENAALSLVGDYRWTPLVRLTVGEAQLNSVGNLRKWRYARCLKAVADDLTRPPHAVEYVLDYRLGPPGIKFFRSVCAVKSRDGWTVLPALTRPRRLDVAAPIPAAASNFRLGDLAALLICREPWSNAWSIVEVVAIDSDEAIEHAIAWADFQRELLNLDFDWAITAAIRELHRESGVRVPGLPEVDLTRCLCPAVRRVIRDIRGLT